MEDVMRWESKIPNMFRCLEVVVTRRSEGGYKRFNRLTPHGRSEILRSVIRGAIAGLALGCTTLPPLRGRLGNLGHSVSSLGNPERGVETILSLVLPLCVGSK
uniref:Uncharacterized protein n=1 Tax=Compsopogon caeruleus TaxID=31354 RepID=A0A7S1XDD8_9RHOD|mmetsp:Transcript_1734/g.3197  ORF Transcript_1734/g.3197 Transcript_1734/m.3197 type:complete len:103 (+) Transcript_1734:120-428(+)